MENFSKHDPADFEDNFGKGFSKEQILQLSLSDIEALDLAENSEHIYPARGQQDG
ncbi:MAG TPA: hypothetical protein VKZ51_10095 [Cyclobacteriaceae bacterium]|nr:hypothetical protein [Cyclobacteriaceae bacterium]